MGTFSTCTCRGTVLLCLDLCSFKSSDVCTYSSLILRLVPRLSPRPQLLPSSPDSPLIPRLSPHPRLSPRPQALPTSPGSPLVPRLSPGPQALPWSPGSPLVLRLSPRPQALPSYPGSPLVPRLSPRPQALPTSPGYPLEKLKKLGRAWYLFPRNLTMHGLGLIKKRLYLSTLYRRHCFSAQSAAPTNPEDYSCKKCRFAAFPQCLRTITLLAYTQLSPFYPLSNL